MTDSGLPCSPAWTNKLFFGDNLKTLREAIDDESIDLVYLDPPFNSSASYNVLFSEKSGERSAAQITAFEDTWHWSRESDEMYREVQLSGGRLARLLESMRAFLGQNDMMAYLVMMAPRLVELRRVLKPNGSLYLHCDPTASHYLKTLLDAVFGVETYRNEIVWKRTTTHSDSKTWSKVADVIFFYTKGPRFIWNTPRTTHSKGYIDSKYHNDDGDGRKYQLDNMTSPNPRPNMMYEWWGFPYPPKGWRYSRKTMAELDADGRIWYPTRADGGLDTTKRPRLKRYLEQTPGCIMGTVWTDIPPINSQAQERLGYPTQKPEALLERIIAASSNEGDVVLDSFCGCGTATSVAEKMNRRWIGIDITHLAIALIRHRLHYAFGSRLAPYEVKGDPKDLAGAKALAELDRYQFEWWALGLVAACPAHDRKKGADRGVDGYIPFLIDNSGATKRAVVQVKSGHVNRSQIGDLNSARIREKADVAVFVTLEPATKQMEREAGATGFYEIDYYQRVPRDANLDNRGVAGRSQARASSGRRRGHVQKTPDPTKRQAASSERSLQTARVTIPSRGRSQAGRRAPWG